MFESEKLVETGRHLSSRIVSVVTPKVGLNQTVQLRRVLWCDHDYDQLISTKQFCLVASFGVTAPLQSLACRLFLADLITVKRHWQATSCAACNLLRMPWPNIRSPVRHARRTSAYRSQVYTGFERLSEYSSHWRL